MLRLTETSRSSKVSLALGRARPDLVKVVRKAMVDCRKTGVSRFANAGLTEVVDGLSSQRSKEERLKVISLDSSKH
jgi:hypothetical protein